MESGQKERVAVINSVFDYGSTGSLARQLYEYGNANGYDIYAFYGRGKTYEDKKIIRIETKAEVYIHKGLSLISGLQGSFSNLATSKLLRYFDEFNINKAILLNLHGYYLNEVRLFDYSRKHDIHIVYVMPDEYSGLGKCAYCDDCKKFLTGCGKCPKYHGYPKSLFIDTSRRIFANKQKEYKGQKIVFAGPRSNLEHLEGSPLLKGKRVEELDWGIDLNTYKYEVNDALYDKYGIPRDKVLVLTAAKYSMTRKGVAEYFFGAARKLEGSEYHFINIGYDGNLPENQIPKNMTVIPYIDQQNEFAQLYSMSDLYVLASTADTQPISALIAFGTGTPVCCFYASGLKYISDGDEDIVRYTKEISVNSLVETIISFGKKDSNIMSKCREYAEKRFSNDLFNQKVFSWL